MLRRELAIVLRARLTWLQAALSSLLVGHGFVLAVDLYSAGSRSARANLLMTREFDPLLGIVRPTLGGLYLALSLLGPLVAARSIAVEKERGSFHALLLQTAAPRRLIAAKLLAALLGVGAQLIAPLALLGLWLAVGGHLAAGETIVPLLGYALYALLVAAIGTAAAAWTRTLAQAATVGLLLVVASWAIDAAEGFAALAWLGRALDWSVTTHLAPLERATPSFAACAWLVVASAGLFALACVGVRFDWHPARRGLAAAGVLAATAMACAAVGWIPQQWDATEQRRASLPPAVVAGLRAFHEPILLTIYLDRDDSRRRQLESDVLAKLRIACPQLSLVYPLDERLAVAEGDRQPDYGRLIVNVGGRTVETYSGSRREIVTLLFATAHRPLPDWTQPEYPGYPRVVEGVRRSALLAIAYLGLPLSLLLAGWRLTRSRRRT